MEIEYNYNGQRFRGFLEKPHHVQPNTPAVIVAHAWRGQDAFARQKARDLADLGYIAFAADLYGDGKQANNDDEAFSLMLPLFLDRKELRDRICAAYETVKVIEHVDQDKIGAIGFCFGGLTVTELFKSGLKLKGVVSFHGLLGDKLGDEKAVILPPSDQMSGSILILHGAQDPMVSSQDIQGFQKLMTDHQIDWQFYSFGKAAHAFTNPEASDKEAGMLYDAATEKRAFRAMENFFQEQFGD